MNKFSGFGLTPFDINFTPFDGYYIEFFEVRLEFTRKDDVKKWKRALFRLSLTTYHRDRGEWLNCNLSLLFMCFRLFSKQLNPPAGRCVSCGLICDDNSFYVGNTPCCDELCAKTYVERKGQTGMLGEE